PAIAMDAEYSQRRRVSFADEEGRMPDGAVNCVVQEVAGAVSAGSPVQPAAAEVTLVMEHLGICLREEARLLLEKGLPDGWAACRTKGGEVYYHHGASGTSQWAHPEKKWAPWVPDSKATTAWHESLVHKGDQPEAAKQHSVYDARSRDVRLPTPSSIFSDAIPSAEREDVQGRAFALHGLLTQAEAASYVASAEASGFRGSDVQREFPSELRNNSRLVHYSDALAAALWRRLAPHLAHRDIYLMQPMGFCAEGRWKPVGVNPCFRISRYSKGQQFAEHCDGMYANDNGECSIYSVVLYLNDDFSDGELQLPEQRLFKPRSGSAVFFPHDTLHAARAVTSGTKYVARSELMFRCVNAGRPPSQPSFIDDPLFQRMAMLYEQIGDLASLGDAAATTAAYQEALGIQFANSLALALRFVEPGQALASAAVSLAWQQASQLGALWRSHCRCRWSGCEEVLEDEVRDLDPEIKDWLGLYRSKHMLERTAPSCVVVFLTDLLQAQLGGQMLNPVPATASHEATGIGWDSSLKQRAGWSIGRKYAKKSWLEKGEVDWDLLPEMFAYAFRLLAARPTENRVVIPAVPGLWSKSVRTRMVQILATRFEVAKVHILPAPLCVLLAHHLTTGTVVWGCSLGISAVYCYLDGKEVATAGPFDFQRSGAGYIARLLCKAADALGDLAPSVLQNLGFA
ncbi:unnamed protein product, partial [Polarella glacialis]